MYINLFYFHTLNSIGGIENFFYQLGKKYGKDYDITILYRVGDPTQVSRLSQYVRVKKYRDGQTIRCKRAFVCFNTEILDNIEAEEYYQMLHGDYTISGIYPNTHPKLQKWISVSQVVQDAYMKGKGKDSIVCYNPFIPVKPRKVLNLISATRLTKDKGFPRMEALARAFEKADIPYTWTVYTDSYNNVVHNKNMILRPPRLDIIEYIANADYFVQLSDAEGYCYSVVESLSVGTPVIVTDFKVAREIGVEDGVNGFILPMSMESIPVDRIYKGLKKFKYTPLEDHWDDLLLPGSNDYQEEMNQETRVRCKKIYFDLQLNKHMGYGEEFTCIRSRAEQLEDLDLVVILE